MAYAHNGQLTRAPEWWRHLRSTKRVFWKAERKAQRLAAVVLITDRETT